VRPFKDTNDIANVGCVELVTPYGVYLNRGIQGICWEARLRKTKLAHVIPIRTAESGISAAFVAETDWRRSACPIVESPEVGRRILWISLESNDDVMGSDPGDAVIRPGPRCKSRRATDRSRRRHRGRWLAAKRKNGEQAKACQQITP
jgi:hypothetical protein